jgi:predicted cupin superfamily sugar epimerase
MSGLGSFADGGSLSGGRMTAADVIRNLDLVPHPVGGHYRESYRDGACTVGYLLLGLGEIAAWHRMDSSESWYWHAGAPLALTTSPDGHDAAAYHLGPHLAGGQQPHICIAPHVWKTAETLGAWTLLSCQAAPALQADGLEIAAADWFPKPRTPAA